MIEIIGYWITVSLLVIPLMLVTGWGFTHYVNEILTTHTDKKHKIQWYEDWYFKKSTVLEAVLIAVMIVLSVVEALILALTTIHYFSQHPQVHDYIRFMQFIGETFGGFVGWVVVVVSGFMGFHLALVGYAKCLNLSDKVKEKESKNV